MPSGCEGLRVTPEWQDPLSSQQDGWPIYQLRVAMDQLKLEESANIIGILASGSIDRLL
jgi:hypothetical protein